jgi:hypothetical protein
MEMAEELGLNDEEQVLLAGYSGYSGYSGCSISPSPEGYSIGSTPYGYSATQRSRSMRDAQALVAAHIVQRIEAWRSAQPSLRTISPPPPPPSVPVLRAPAFASSRAPGVRRATGAVDAVGAEYRLARGARFRANSLGFHTAGRLGQGAPGSGATVQRFRVQHCHSGFVAHRCNNATVDRLNCCTTLQPCNGQNATATLFGLGDL